MFIYVFQIQGKMQRTNAEIIKNSHSLFWIQEGTSQQEGEGNKPHDPVPYFSA